MGRAFAAADEGLGAGNEFAEVEGLGEVVVCAGVEQLNDGAGAVFGGEDEHRGGVFAGTQAAQNAEAVEFGQHEIENDEIVDAIAGGVVAGLAVRGPIDREAGAVAQGGSEVFRQPNFVFHQQNAHDEPCPQPTLWMQQA